MRRFLILSALMGSAAYGQAFVTMSVGPLQCALVRRANDSVQHYCRLGSATTGPVIDNGLTTIPQDGLSIISATEWGTKTPNPPTQPKIRYYTVVWEFTIIPSPIKAGDTWIRYEGCTYDADLDKQVPFSGLLTLVQPYIQP